MLLLTRGRCTSCDHIFRKSVTPKYLMTLYYVGANVSTTSKFCKVVTVAIDYWVPKHTNVSDIWCCDLKAEFRTYTCIVSKVIRFKAHTWPYNKCVLIKSETHT
jgi:hypothetical protein